MISTFATTGPHRQWLMHPVIRSVSPTGAAAGQRASRAVGHAGNTRRANPHRATNKKAGARPAFPQQAQLTRKSVLRDDRATPAIVDAAGDQVGVATGAEAGDSADDRTG